MAMLLLWGLLALTSSSYGQSWSQVEGSLSFVSVDMAGVWGVNAANLIYFRENNVINSKTISANDDCGTERQPMAGSNGVGDRWTQVQENLCTSLPVQQVWSA